MKKIFILPLSVILFSFSSVQAQIGRGSLFLGGNINMNFNNTKATDNTASSKSDNFSISPVIGKAIKDNLVLGASLIYTYNKYTQAPNIPGVQKTNGYGVNIFLRKYKSIGRNFYLFLEGALGGNYTKSNNSPVAAYNNTKRTTLGLSATPGISYAISRKFHLEAGLNNIFGAGYSHEKGDKGGNNYNTPYKSNSFNVYTGLNNNLLSSVYFGFKFFLGK